MALSPIHTMFLLLASFFFLPSLHAIPFEYCNEEGYVYGNISRVDISPDPVGGDNEPIITFYGFADSSSDTIYRGKLVVYIYSTPYYDNTFHTLATKIIDENEGIIEHGKNFELSIRVPKSVANQGSALVYITLIDERPINDDEPQERLCFNISFPSEYDDDTT